MVLKFPRMLQDRRYFVHNFYRILLILHAVPLIPVSFPAARYYNTIDTQTMDQQPERRRVSYVVSVFYFTDVISRIRTASPPPRYTQTFSSTLGVYRFSGPTS